MRKQALQIIAATVTLLVATSAQAINANYAKKLERSGCTQASEMQGCDINKTKAENAKAGFVSGAPAETGAASGKTSYAGNWVAKAGDGATVASIRIDAKDQVSVNGKRVKAKRSDGALVFKQGFITYTIQGKGEGHWRDSDAKTTGPIHGE